MTNEHRRAALEKANAVRMVRAELKRLIAARDVSVLSVVESGSAETQTMRIYALLMAQPRWGRNKTMNLLRDACLSESMTVGMLTVQERTRLGDCLSRASMTERMVARQVARWQRPRAAA